MAKIGILPFRHKQTASGVPLYLTIRHKGRRSTLSLGIRIKEKHWNENRGEVRRSHPDHARINQYLMRRRSEAQRIVTEMMAEGDRVDPKAVKAELTEDDEGSSAGGGFVAYCQHKEEQYRGRGQIATADAYRTAHRHFKEFLEEERGRPEVPIAKLDGPLVSDFKTWLVKEKGNKPNTVHKKVGGLHTLWNRARKEGLVETGASDPWDAVTLTKEQAQKEKLTLKEIKKLRGAELDGLQAEVRDWFMFAFYAGGMRVSDVCLVKRKHVRQDEEGNWRIRYKMKKTRDGLGILLIDPAVEILRRYDFEEKGPEERLFPILDGYDLSTPEKVKKAIGTRTALINKYLKQIQEKAEIETKITTHVARHSLAAYLYEEKGYDIYTIRDILGHANVRITQTYLDGFDYSTSDEAIRSIDLD